MRVLYVILILSVAAIVWAAIAVARHIRNGGAPPLPSNADSLGLSQREHDPVSGDPSE